MIFKQGIVSEWKPGYAKVYFEVDDFVTTWLQIVYPFTLKDKSCFPLSVNEQVACLMDEYCEDGIIFGATYSSQDTPPNEANDHTFVTKFEDGTILKYDKSTHILTADVKGEADLKALTVANVEAPIINLKGVVNVIGPLTAGGISIAPITGITGADGKVTGDLNVTGTVSADTDVKSGLITLKTHKHTAPSGGGLTTAPV